MSPSLENIESAWLAQYAVMRQTLDEMRSEQLILETKGYGHEIVLEDEDFTCSSGSEDLWNTFSDDELDVEHSRDMTDGVTDYPNGKPMAAYPYKQEWLRSRCLDFASSKPGMDAAELQQKLSAMLASDMRGLCVEFLLLPDID